MMARPIEEGAEAFHSGYRLNENPYTKHSSAWQAWRDGFQQEQKQYRAWQRTADGKAQARLRDRLTYKPRSK